MKESKIENEVCKHAKALEWLVYKFVSPGKIGVPDRMFIRNNQCFFIEFKTYGKKPTKVQHRRHKELRDQGYFVAVIDNVESGITLFNCIERGKF